MKNEEEWIKSSRLGVKYLIMYPLYPANSLHFSLFSHHYSSFVMLLFVFNFSLFIIN